MTDIRSFRLINSAKTMSSSKENDTLTPVWSKTSVSIRSASTATMRDNVAFTRTLSGPVGRTVALERATGRRLEILRKGTFTLLRIYGNTYIIVEESN